MGQTRPELVSEATEDRRDPHVTTRFCRSVSEQRMPPRGEIGAIHSEYAEVKFVALPELRRPKPTKL